MTDENSMPSFFGFPRKENYLKIPSVYPMDFFEKSPYLTPLVLVNQPHAFTPEGFLSVTTFAMSKKGRDLFYNKSVEFDTLYSEYKTFVAQGSEKYTEPVSEQTFLDLLVYSAFLFKHPIFGGFNVYNELIIHLLPPLTIQTVLRPASFKGWPSSP
jgi:hypothetical protein